MQVSDPQLMTAGPPVVGEMLELLGGRGGIYICGFEQGRFMYLRCASDPLSPQLRPTTPLDPLRLNSAESQTFQIATSSGEWWYDDHDFAIEYGDDDDGGSGCSSTRTCAH
jgi:hypothetical protein